MSHGMKGGNANKYFEIVSPLVWKHYPTFLFNRFSTRVHSNIATCSDRSTCQVCIRKNTSLTTLTNPRHFQHSELIVIPWPLASFKTPCLAMGNLDNSDNPGPDTDWLPSITNQCTQASVPIPAFLASTSTWWASRYPPCQWWGQNPPSVPSDSSPFSPYSNCFMMIVPFQSYAYYLFMHPHFLNLASLLPWLLALV